MGEVIARDGADKGRLGGRWDMSLLGSVHECADNKHSATAHSLLRNRRERESWWALGFLYPCECPQLDIRGAHSPFWRRHQKRRQTYPEGVLLHIGHQCRECFKAAENENTIQFSDSFIS